MTTEDRGGEAVIARAAAGARLLTVRGAGMRVVSVASNLLLIVLVPPAGLGLLAVVRGVTGLTGNTSDLGFAWALLRRPEPPTDEEYGALAGLQLLLIALIVATMLAVPSLLSLGAIPAGSRVAMLVVLGTLLTVPIGTTARVRLERQMDYRRISIVEFTSVILQNGVLIVAALTGHFVLGVFLSTGMAIIYTNLLYWWWSPGPLPSVNLPAWRRLGHEFAGFSLGHVGSLLGASATPIIIANLFGLPVAGVWAFAVRLGNVLQLTFEGFRRAIVPAAAALTESGDSLRRLVQGSLQGAARLAIPMIALLYLSLPVLGLLLPRWQPAVLVAQVYLVGFGLSGLLAAALVPVGVARSGARTVLLEQYVPVLSLWAGLAVLGLLHSPSLVWVILPSYVLLALVLWWNAEPITRPSLTPELTRSLAALLLTIVISTIGPLVGVPIIVTALAAAISFVAVAHFTAVLFPARFAVDSPRAW